MPGRKILVVTGTRADYGLLFWLLKEIGNDPELELNIAVTGMHLSPEYGMTYKAIEEDGFIIDEKVENLLSGDTPTSTTKSIGLGVVGFADVIQKLEPDMMVVNGDRFEVFAAAQAAVVAGVPIAHIHGGETTEGSLDEVFRHAITKMAHFHFTASEVYKNRVIQMGENPSRVINVGAIGLDYIKKTKLLNRKELEEAIAFELGDINFLVTYHPETVGRCDVGASFDELLKAFDAFPSSKIIFTKPNADFGNKVISEKIDRYVALNNKRACAYVSLGQLKYLSAMGNVDIIIGNSSSGIFEAPAFNKPTVNIGNRQKGRLKSESVIDCDEKSESIIEAIRKGLSPEFRKIAENAVSPFGTGGASVKIKDFIKDVDLSGNLIKEFYDIPFKN